MIRRLSETSLCPDALLFCALQTDRRFVQRRVLQLRMFRLTAIFVFPHRQPPGTL
jgi:hypothetical protein